MRPSNLLVLASVIALASPVHADPGRLRVGSLFQDKEAYTMEGPAWCPPQTPVVRAESA